MKILIIGERYSSNLGDPIICETVQYQILEYFPYAKIFFFDISGRNDYPEYHSTENILIKGRISTIKKKISLKLTKLGFDMEFIKFRRTHKSLESYIQEICNQSYDLAIFAGGQLFKDTFVFAIADFVHYLSSRDTPIIFNACGVGEIVSPKMRTVLATALSNSCVKVVTTRDDIQTINNQLLVDDSKKAVKTYDPALWVREVYGVEKRKSDIVGLGIMFAHNMNYNDMIVFWTDVVRELNSKNINWRFFCNGSIKDYKLASHILKTIGYSDNKIKELLLPRPTRPIDLVKLISGFDSIISFRLHSHIVAYSLDIPGIAIVWDQKLRYFYRSMDLENRCKDLNDEAVDIILELENEKYIGYDKALRKRQKKESNDLLISSIKRAIR